MLKSQTFTVDMVLLQSHRNTKTSGNSCIIIIWYRAPHSHKDINRPSEHFPLTYSAELLQMCAKRQTFQMAIGTHATVLPPTRPPSKETHRIWAIPTSGLGRGWGVRTPGPPAQRSPGHDRWKEKVTGRN